MKNQKLLLSLWAGYFLFLCYWAFQFWSSFPAFMDTLEYVFPEKWFNVQCFQAGSIPLWNPYIACGTPHLANFQSASFYPLFWLWNLTGLTHWFFTAALIHTFLAAIGFYLWLRCWKAGEGLASLGAFAWSGSAYLTLLWGFPTHLAALTWLPWIFWVTQRSLKGFSWGNWLALAGFWSLAILAGYPIFTFYALVFWIVFVLAQGGWKHRTGLGTALLLAVGCSAVQWLPFLELLGYMHREIVGGHPYHLRWVEYLTLFWPEILGTPGTENYRGEYGNFIFGNLYLGVIPLVVLLWSFWDRRGRLGFWQKSLLFCLLFPLGTHFVLWRIFPETWLDKLEVSKESFLVLFCAMTAAVVVITESSQKKMVKIWLKKYGWVLAAIWILDILSVPFRLIHPVPDPYQDPQVKAFAQRVKALVGEGRIVSVRTKEDVYSSAVTDYAGSFRETAERMTQNTNVVWGIRSAQAHLTTVVDGYQNLSLYLKEGYPYDSRILDGAGVKLILSQAPLQAFKYGVKEPQESWQLIYNAGALPGAWTANQAHWVTDRAKAFGALLDSKVFLENECWLEKDTAGKATELAPVAQQSLLMDDSFCGSQFAVPAGLGNYFILGQTFTPGWHAWVDGRPASIFRANGLWMAVGIEANVPHQVLFEYSPVSFRVGLFLSLIAAVFFLSGVLKFFIR